MRDGNERESKKCGAGESISSQNVFVCLLHVCMNVSCFVCIMLCSIQMPLKAWFINRADESRHL